MADELTHDGVMTSPVLRAAAVMVMGFVMATSAVPAIAAESSEGPGYGGKADKLDVAWSQDSQVVTASASDKPGAPVPQSLDGDAGMDPTLLSAGPAGPQLTVFGVGFRGKSDVNLRVGGGRPLDVRVDDAGTLQIDVPRSDSVEAQPGTSVLAQGRGPSGATRTLVGAVPPLPSGTSPAQFVPWLAGIGAVVFAGWWLRRRVTT